MKAIKITGALLVILLAGWLLQRSLSHRPSDEESAPPSGLGVVLAEQAVKAMADRGRLVLIDLPIGSVNSDARLEGFVKTLARHKNVKLVATKNFDKSEVGLMSLLSFEQLAAVVKEHAEVDVIVSFLGVSSITDAQIATLPKPCPKLVVFNWKLQDVRRGMKAEVVQAAVVEKELRALPADDPKTPLEWFNRYYQLITPDTAKP